MTTRRSHPDAEAFRRGRRFILAVRLLAIGAMSLWMSMMLFY